MRRPLVHFLLIGGLLFALELALRGEATRPPAPQAGDEELLFREALALGLDRGDPVVIRRLARNMRFLREGAGAGEAALVREARALAMHESDLVVRRRLVQRMELLAWAAADAREPTEAELRRWFEAHRERFAEPGRVRISHVYLSRERRSAALARDAQQLLAALRAGGHAPAEAAALGDPFLHGHHLPPLTEAQLAARFGADFARAALALPGGEWSGPLSSSYGLHLVFVVGARAERRLSFAEARAQVLAEVAAQRRAEARAALLAVLRARGEAGG